jgi:hypothetical protein
MGPTRDPDEGRAKVSQLNARDIVELIDDLIKTRIAEEQGVVFNSDRIELMKRAIVDYLLVTDPRAGVFVNSETKRP